MLTSLWSGEKLFKYARKSENHYRKDKDIIKRLKKVLDTMVEINDGKDICDYRKEVKNGKSGTC